MSGKVEVVGSIDYEAKVRINPLKLDFSRFTSPECEHCHTRHERKITYIVRLEDGSLIQVGKGCLDKILGNVPRHIDYDEREMFFELTMGGSGKHYMNTRDFLYCLIKFSNKIGIYDYKSFNLDAFYEKYDEYIDYKNKARWDYTEVNKVLEFYKNTDFINDFLDSIKNILKGEEFNTRHFNIVKYAYRNYLKIVNYKSEYHSVKVDYTNTTVKEIALLDSTGFQYGWNSYKESYKYRIIDNHDNIFEFYTAKQDLVQKGDKIRYKIKDTRESRKFGIINFISYVRKEL